MSYAYGYGFGGHGSMTGEHPTTASQSQRWASQAAAAKAYGDEQWERGREMHERGLQMQEQNRRKMDSESARELGKMKFGVLGGLLGVTPEGRHTKRGGVGQAEYFSGRMSQPFYGSLRSR